MLRQDNKSISSRLNVGIFAFSERFREAFEVCWEPHRKTSRRLGMSQGWAKPEHPALAGLDPTHIPQLLWKDTFDTLFAGALCYQAYKRGIYQDILFYVARKASK